MPSIIKWIRDHGMKFIGKKYQPTEQKKNSKDIPLLYSAEDQIIVFPAKRGVNVFINQLEDKDFSFKEYQMLFRLDDKQ